MQPAPATAAGGAGPAPRPREGFASTQRLRAPGDFDQARRLGRRVEAGAFTLRLTVRADGPRRLGVIASRKAGPAVKRNYAKRLLRELFRRHQDVLPPACDIVVIVRPNFFEHPFAEIRERYLHAVRQAAKGRTVAS